jgi:3-methyladenine DNA glycosylase AlkD
MALREERTMATAKARAAALVEELRGLGVERNRVGMARYGINVADAFGVSIQQLRPIARRLGRDHALAASLWATGVHEARILACFVEEPAAVTPAQMEAWAAAFDSWDLCDQACTSLFDRTPHAWRKASAWSRRRDAWVKRAGFSLMAGLASHDGAAADRDFLEFLPLIEAGAFDERNYVKKAVSWALRNLGKRNRALHRAVAACAGRIRAEADARAGGPRGGSPDQRAARWVAADVSRELTDPRTVARLEATEARLERRRSAAGGGAAQASGGAARQAAKALG